jgi:hypothetical protein
MEHYKQIVDHLLARGAMILAPLWMVKKWSEGIDYDWSYLDPYFERAALDARNRNPVSLRYPTLSQNLNEMSLLKISRKDRTSRYFIFDKHSEYIVMVKEDDLDIVVQKLIEANVQVLNDIPDSHR